MTASGCIPLWKCMLEFFLPFICALLIHQKLLWVVHRHSRYTFAGLCGCMSRQKSGICCVESTHLTPPLYRLLYTSSKVQSKRLVLKSTSTQRHSDWSTIEWTAELCDAACMLRTSLAASHVSCVGFRCVLVSWSSTVYTTMQATNVMPQNNVHMIGMWFMCGFVSLIFLNPDYYITCTS